MATLASGLTSLLSAFRDYVVNGVPASGAREPPKAEIRAGLTELVAAITTNINALLAAASMGGAKAYATDTLLYAEANNDVTVGLVYADPTEGQNGLYVRIANGTGSNKWSLTNLILNGDLAAELADKQDQSAFLDLLAPGLEEARAALEIVDAVQFTESSTFDLFLQNALGQVGGFSKRSTGELRLAGIDIVNDGRSQFIVKNRLGQPMFAYRGGLSNEARIAALEAGGGGGGGPVLSVPVATDGRSLKRWKAGVARIEHDAAGKLLFMTSGDSYGELNIIAGAMGDLLFAEFGKAGDGWINVRGAVNPYGIVLTRSGFSTYDASSGVEPTVRVGLDGHAAYTTGTSGLMTITGSVATEFRIFYDQQTGRFRWRVDEGSWTTVSGNGSGDLGILTIAGLDLEAHTLEISTSVNTGGMVNILGVYSVITDAVGAVVLKAGNSSLQGSDYPLFAADAAEIVAALGVDVIQVLLGTNDYQRVDATPANFSAGIETFVNACRARRPTVGHILTIAPRTQGTTVTPLSDYRDAMYALAAGIDCEFYNTHDEWGTYAESNAEGLMTDLEHPNARGGHLMAARVKSLLLDL